MNNYYIIFQDFTNSEFKQFRFVYITNIEDQYMLDFKTAKSHIQKEIPGKYFAALIANKNICFKLTEDEFLRIIKYFEKLTWCNYQLIDNKLYYLSLNERIEVNE